jgi:hypothetical protein
MEDYLDSKKLPYVELVAVDSSAAEGKGEEQLFSLSESQLKRAEILEQYALVQTELQKLVEAPYKSNEEYKLLRAEIIESFPSFEEDEKKLKTLIREWFQFDWYWDMWLMGNGERLEFCEQLEEEEDGEELVVRFKKELIRRLWNNSMCHKKFNEDVEHPEDRESIITESIRKSRKFFYYNLLNVEVRVGDDEYCIPHLAQVLVRRWNRVSIETGSWAEFQETLSLLQEDLQLELGSRVLIRDAEAPDPWGSGRGKVSVL